MSSTSKKFYGISWVLHDDPDSVVHFGPPLFLKKTSASGKLLLVPRDKNFVEHKCRFWNSFAKRGTHTVYELADLNYEMVRLIKQTHGQNIYIQRR